LDVLAACAPRDEDLERLEEQRRDRQALTALIDTAAAHYRVVLSESRRVP